MPLTPAEHDPESGAPAGAIDAAATASSTRKEELRSFFFFTIVMAPALAVLLVAGYGFAVWMYQLLAGPPVR